MPIVVKRCSNILNPPFPEIPDTLCPARVYPSPKICCLHICARDFYLKFPQPAGFVIEASTGRCLYATLMLQKLVVDVWAIARDLILQKKLKSRCKSVVSSQAVILEKANMHIQ